MRENMRSERREGGSSCQQPRASDHDQTAMRGVDLPADNYGREARRFSTCCLTNTYPANPTGTIIEMSVCVLLLLRTTCMEGVSFFVKLTGARRITHCDRYGRMRFRPDLEISRTWQVASIPPLLWRGSVGGDPRNDREALHYGVVNTLAWVSGSDVLTLHESGVDPLRISG
ncbi:hypothetical protein L209DRAFT_448888 [Thermothelomyces heterothallicus CBS 203.75]